MDRRLGTLSPRNSAGAGSNYSHQFLCISAIAFNATRINVKVGYKVSRDIHFTKFDEVRGKLRRDLNEIVTRSFAH
jgi:hypothetical protein